MITRIDEFFFCFPIRLFYSHSQKHTDTNAHTGHNLPDNIFDFDGKWKKQEYGGEKSRNTE